MKSNVSMTEKYETKDGFVVEIVSLPDGLDGLDGYPVVAFVASPKGGWKEYFTKKGIYRKGVDSVHDLVKAKKVK